MGLGRGILEPLAAIGRQRAWAVAATVALGIAFPAAGRWLEPVVTHAIVVMLVIAFLRVDVGAMRAHLARPKLLLLALLWTAVGVPLAMLLFDVALGLGGWAPETRTALVLQAITSPLMSAPAFAGLLGLDVTLVLAMLISASVVVPVTATLWAAAFGLGLALAPIDLAVRLAALIGGAAGVGLVLRSALGTARIAAGRDALDGLNIVALYVFIAALFGSTVEVLLVDPWRVAGLTVLVFGVFFALLSVTAIAFMWAGREAAAAVAIASSMRNMGIMMAAMGGVVPETTWIYIAVGQLPLYLSPLLLPPLLTWWRGAAR